MRRLLHILPLLALWLCACRQPQPEAPEPLAATVPAEAREVVRADLDALLKMADCPSQGGSIALTPELGRLLDGWEYLPLLEACAARGDRLDLSEAYWIDLGDGHDALITAMLKHPADEPADMTADSAGAGVAWLSDGRQAWMSLADGDALAATVDSVLARAKVLNLFDSKGITADFFTLRRTVAAMRRGENTANPLGDAYDAAYVSVDVRDRAIAAEVRFAGGGRWVDATSLMQPIDPEDAFASQPPGCVLAAAAGVNPNSLCRALSAMPGLRFDRRFTLSLFVRILGVKGTLSLAMAPGGRAETIRDFNLRHWDARLNMPINGDPVRALDFADRYLPPYCYAEADSQWLYASTYEPGTYEPYTDLQPDIEPSCRVAVAVRIPYSSETMKALRLRSGYSLDIRADSAVRVNLRLLGPAEYLLPSLIEDLRWREATENR